MGQQQLLLVILVTIIVGIATVVAINIFGTAADQANRDAVRQDLMAAGVQAQAIWARPSLMNGADRNFTKLSEGQIIYRLNIPGDISDDSSEVRNENGVYTLNTVSDTSAIQIVGEPASGEGTLTATVDRDEDGNWQINIEETD